MKVHWCYAFVFLCLTQALPENEVDTPSGRIRGSVTSITRNFFGIPYAKPPVGNRRWKAPEEYPSWSNTMDATTFGYACPQPILDFIIYPNIKNQSEDCLFLNVYTPRLSKITKPLPVMVWIHGGAYTGGSGQGYNGTQLAGNFPVIVVTINYRLGPLGFLALGTLAEEDPLGSTGNYGMMDQQLALKWVQKNIKGFGGDPSMVTVFGESAGGGSIEVHLTSPLSKGLFSGAIIESGCLDLIGGYTASVLAGEAFAAELLCVETFGPAYFLNCLRSRSAQQITELAYEQMNNPFLAWNPVIDGVLLPEEPHDMMRAGNFSNKVPILAGGNKNEGSAFIYQIIGGDISPFEYEIIVGGYWGDGAPQILQQYPLSNYPSPYWALSAAIGDYILKCPSRMVAQYLSDLSVPSFLYEFSHNSTQFLWNFTGNPPLGSFHGAEIAFVFGDQRYPFTAEEKVLAQAMMTYWTNFATYRNPGSFGGLTWPQWTPTADGSIDLNLKTSIGKGEGTPELCNFWFQYEGSK